MRLALFLIPVFLLLGIWAGWLLIPEYKVTVMSQAPASERLRWLRDNPPQRPPATLRANQILFLSCDDALRSRLAILQPEPTRRKIAAYCADVAEEFLARTPGSSLGHFTAAVAAWINRQDESMNAHLLASQRNGRFESWLAMRRFKLALAADEALSPQGEAALEGDILALLQSPAGRNFLAAYYVRQPAMRERIGRAAETLSEEIQASFLGLVRKQLSNRATRS